MLASGDAGDGVEHMACPRVLDQAVVAADDPVGPACVEPAGDSAAVGVRVGGRRFVAIRDGLALHADDASEFTRVPGDHRPEELLDLGLFAAQLNRVGDG